MKYAVFIRGINVGGKSLIKMSELKRVLEESGFENVVTFIASGNVILESDEKSARQLEQTLNTLLSKAFHFDIAVTAVTHAELQTIVAAIPAKWKNTEEYRCYLAFTIAPMTPAMILKEAKPKEGIDVIKGGDGVVYMATTRAGIMKTGFTKLIGTKVYKGMTMRNYTTVQKVLALMEG